MSKPIIITALAFILAVGICMPRGFMLESLSGRYKEALRHEAMSFGNTPLEVFVSSKGDFTIIQTFTNMMSCVVASGTSWRDVEHSAPKGEPV